MYVRVLCLDAQNLTLRLLGATSNVFLLNQSLKPYFIYGRVQVIYPGMLKGHLPAYERCILCVASAGG